MSILQVKADSEKKPHRLTNIATQFVSLVQRGANRQSKFFVVKADEAGLGPGGECVCTECGHTVPHKTAEQCNEMECPECGGKMTRKETAGGDAKEKDQSRGTPGPKNTSGVGSDAEGAPVADLGAWLAAAGDTVEAMFIDHRIDVALNAPPSTTPAMGPEDEQAQDGTNRSAPSEEAPPAGGEDDELTKAQQEAETLRRRLKKETEARQKAELREKRLLKSTVGGTTALLSGVVDLAAQQEKREQPVAEQARKAWVAGGDLAK